MVELKQASDNTWCVVYHAPDGMHHDFFASQAKARAFASEYYGVAV